jgi:hypothetical protein
VWCVYRDIVLTCVLCSTSFSLSLPEISKARQQRVKHVSS